MDEMLSKYLTPEVTAIIITVIILPVLKSLTKYFVTWMNTKIDSMQKNIHNDKINHYIDRAEDAVMTSVDSVSQTYVDVLKQRGEFTEEARKEAFEKAKEQALLMISEEGKGIITEVHGDVDVWLTNKIENYVKNNKKV